MRKAALGGSLDAARRLVRSTLEVSTESNERQAAWAFSTVGVARAAAFLGPVGRRFRGKVGSPTTHTRHHRSR